MWNSRNKNFEIDLNVASSSFSDSSLDRTKQTSFSTPSSLVRLYLSQRPNVSTVVAILVCANSYKIVYILCIISINVMQIVSYY